MTNEEMQIKIIECNLKIREHHDRHSIEAEKHSVEFSKIIITTLIWINTAGIGAIPTILTFLGINLKTPEAKYNFAFFPGSMFALGLFLALLCAFFIYINFGYIAASHNEDNIFEFNTFSYLQHTTTLDDKMFSQLKESTDDAISKGKNYRYLVKLYFWLSIITGFGSFIFFVAGGFSIILQTSNVLH